MKLLIKIKYYSSILSYKFIKGYFSFMYDNFISRFNKKEWKILAEKFKIPGALLYVMVNAPRWNTHAIISTVGPLKVDNKILISGLKKINKQTKSWTLVVYDQSNNETICSVSGDIHVSDTAEIQLDRGNYSIGIRFYECEYPLTLPIIKTDIKDNMVEERILKTKPNFYPPEIWGKNNFLFKFLHCYILILLEGLVKRSNRFINKEFLPVGNPQTNFKYGVILPRDFFSCDFSSIDFSKNLVYYTLYNSSSFPIESKRITQNTLFIEESGYFRTYLIRIVRINKY